MPRSISVSILQINVSLKAASMGGLSRTSTVSVTVALHPLLLSTVSVTTLKPMVLYFQLGLAKLDVSACVVASPKSHRHLLGTP
jgi:hypothetical protein